MYTLGIETSCDETAAAVVKDAKIIVSNAVSSSLFWHKKYGGIVPEIASRKQMEAITQIAGVALSQAKLTLDKIGLISVTCGPGLIGSLIVGLEFAKAISLAKKIPLVGVNHLYSHIYACFLNLPKPRMPLIALVVSGGHTIIYLLHDFDKIQTLGTTNDDACGETFDKVAKILGLGYPGGPVIERRAAQAGSNSHIRFSCLNPKKPLDFSFSGIKTAVLYYVKKHGLKNKQKINQICWSFQESVIDSLVVKTLSACRKYKVKHLAVSGGVAANMRLRDRFQRESRALAGLNLYFPPKQLCTDNAAMVAGFGYQIFKKGHRSSFSLNLALD
ncbi:MAG: tRNA (adenosine(37)-N6)-threonylcarbamoyltransferase complex transferase subunit TsaD [Candidatus Omnitrophota bacterium]|nr:tRNA (adenosine(37)-N6)-threonylcarbamoyltransferase complex transferase subunit TsaD [Candidatus Omnitrophota bacterium]